MLDVLMAWAQATEAFLEQRGIELHYGRTRDNRPNPSCFLSIRRGSTEADLVLWESGEADLGFALPDQQPPDTQQRVAGLDDLAALVASMLAPFGPDRGDLLAK